MAFNLGGALADISWLEAGDVPIVSFHCYKDEYAPIDTGDVIVPTTGDFVVEVMGSRTIAHYSNAYGNNDVFVQAGFTDDFTNAANVNNSGYEGLYVFKTPAPSTTPNAFDELQEEWGAPWDWWDNTTYGIQAEAVNGVPGMTSPAFFEANALLGNPDMSALKGNLYLDTIQAYLNPRIFEVLGFNISSVTGCIDATACNYDPTATVDDGSCIYQGEAPLVACYETATWNASTCVWDVTGTPILASILQSGSNLTAVTNPVGLSADWYNIQTENDATRIWLMETNASSFTPTFDCS